MKDISLHILDIAQNSIAAGADTLTLDLKERDGLLTVVCTDNGRGMAPDFLAEVTDPFRTTRTTRKVGLGLPLLRLAAEQTGGSLAVESREGEGTRVTAVFRTGHIDCPPLEGMADTVSLLVQGAPGMRLVYTRATPAGALAFDTEEVRAVLGPDISLAEPEVALWIRAYIRDLEDALHPQPDSQ